MTKKLWNEYLFLTREMDKFLAQQDYDLFFEIMRQRENVQQRIDEAAGGGYQKTPEGREVLRQIQVKNLAIMQKLQLFLNRAKQQRAVARAYDGAGGRPMGIRLDRQG